MTNYDGPDRRRQSLEHEHLAEMIRLVVREEIRAAAHDGRMLSDTDRHDIREWLQQRKKWSDLRQKLIGNTIGWVIIVAIGGIGLAVWEAIKDRAHQP